MKIMKTLWANVALNVLKRQTWVIAMVSALGVIGNLSAATLIGMWDFDGNYHDGTGNYDFEAFGSVSLVPGKGGLAASFDGGSEPHPNSLGDIDVLQSKAWPDKASFGSGFSLMGFLRHRQGTTPSEVNSGPIFHQTSSGDNWGYAVNLDKLGILSVSLRDAADNRLNAATTVAIPEETWTHFSVTWDGSLDGGLSFFLDGNQTPVTISHSGFTGLSGNGVPIHVGATPLNESSSGYDHGYSGDFDHVSFWNGPLSPEEVRRDSQFFVRVPDHLGGGVSQLLFGGLLLAGWLWRASGGDAWRSGNRTPVSKAR